MQQTQEKVEQIQQTAGQVNINYYRTNVCIAHNLSSMGAITTSRSPHPPNQIL